METITSWRRPVPADLDATVAHRTAAAPPTLATAPCAAGVQAAPDHHLDHHAESEGLATFAARRARQFSLHSFVSDRALSQV